MDARSSSSIQPIIEAKHLRKSFGSFIAVDDISFTVPPGECFGILGPNGAGKTTAIRMLYGFSPMTGGTLRIFGLDVPKDIRSIKARIGVCQQENNLDPDLTVFRIWKSLPATSTCPGCSAVKEPSRFCLLSP
jgi:lipooligosaccharide transport system ATP-binding protein